MADGESLAISVPAGETRVLKHFQARMPYELVVPDVAHLRRSFDQCSLASRFTAGASEFFILSQSGERPER